MRKVTNHGDSEQLPDSEQLLPPLLATMVTLPPSTIPSHICGQNLSLTSNKSGKVTTFLRASWLLYPE